MNQALSWQFLEQPDPGKEPDPFTVVTSGDLLSWLGIGQTHLPVGGREPPPWRGEPHGF